MYLEPTFDQNRINVIKATLEYFVFTQRSGGKLVTSMFGTGAGGKQGAGVSRGAGFREGAARPAPVAQSNFGTLHPLIQTGLDNGATAGAPREGAAMLA
jgi:hypothetical protein